MASEHQTNYRRKGDQSVFKAAITSAMIEKASRPKSNRFNIKDLSTGTGDLSVVR